MSFKGLHCSKSPTEPAAINIPVVTIPEDIAGRKYSYVCIILGAIPASSWKKYEQGPPTPVVAFFSNEAPCILDLRPLDVFLLPILTSICCCQSKTFSGLLGLYQAVCSFKKVLYSSRNFHEPLSLM